MRGRSSRHEHFPIERAFQRTAMDRIPSQHPAPATAAARTGLAMIASGLARFAGHVTHSPALNQLKSVLNQPSPAAVAPAACPLPEGGIHFEEVTDDLPPGGTIAAGLAGDEEMEPGELSTDEIHGMRAALAALKEQACQADGTDKSRYSTQIARIEAALAGQAEEMPPHERAVPSADRQLVPYSVPAYKMHAPDVGRAEQARPRGVPTQAALPAPISVINSIRLSVANVIAPPTGTACALTSPGRDLIPAPGAGLKEVTTYRAPTFALPADKPKQAKAMNTLFGNVGIWCSSHIESFSADLKRSGEVRARIAATPLPDSYTPLEVACHLDSSTSLRDRLLKTSRIESIKKLVIQDTHDGNPNEGSYGPAHLAVMRNKPKRLEVLLKAAAGKIDLDRVSPAFKNTALGLSLKHADWRCTELLLKAGATLRTADFETLVEQGESVLFKQLHDRLKTQATFGRNVGRAADPVDFQSILSTAIMSGRLDIARVVLEGGCMPALQNNEMLQRAAASGNAGIARLLLRHMPAGAARLDDRVNPDRSPLALAMRFAHHETVAVLLEQRPDRAWVSDATDSLEETMSRRSPHEQDRFAPLLSLLHSWLQPQHPGTTSRIATAPLPALTPVGEAANDPVARANQTHRPSRKVFALSETFPPARAL